MCAALVNMEAARVVYKNNYSFGAKLFNIYMVSGGTHMTFTTKQDGSRKELMAKYL